MAPVDVESIGHIARLAVLAMCVRGVAGGEFESSPEILSVRFTVTRSDGSFELPVDVEYIGTHSMPLGGMSL